MYTSHFAIYLGEESQTEFLGFIAEQDIFAILEIPDSYTKEKAKSFLNYLSEKFKNIKIENLTSFETILNNEIHVANLPINFSLAIGLLRNNIFFLKAFGRGEIFIRRGQEFEKLIDNNNSASGLVKNLDFYVFSTAYFSERLGGIDKMKKMLAHKHPSEIIDELTPVLKGNDDEKAVALFISLTKENEVVLDETAIPDENNKKNIFFELLKKIDGKFFQLNNTPEANRRKKITLLLVGVIFIILLWSVGFGYKRRIEAKQSDKIKKTKEIINQKLQSAEEEAFLNLERALTLVSESKTEFTKLKEQINIKTHEKDVNEIKTLIDNEEAKLLKKEEKNYEEFSDLTLENKDSKGDALSLYGDNLSIIDNQKKIIYTLSLTKKSLEKTSFSELSSTKIIGSYEDSVFLFIINKGVYKISNNKIKKIIENDKDWKEISGLTIYNGNIYLVDKGNDEIYKYLSSGEDYSNKTSYFKSGEAIDLEDFNSIAIDSAVYLSLQDRIVKYLAGAKEVFKVVFPNENIHLDQVFTNKDLEKVYAWDKNNGVIYILTKNGTYEKQIKSNILSKAQDLVFYDNSAYVLAGQKIYLIKLN